jgi:hypothetical protein
LAAQGPMRLFTPMIARTMTRQFAGNSTYLRQALEKQSRD